MRKIIICFIFLFFVKNISAQQIAFPPELMWWIYEIQKVNKSVEVSAFQQGGSATKNFVTSNTFNGGLSYPVFMRWNYSGNLIGYYNYNSTAPRRLSSGKYSIGGDFDDVGHLYIAERDKNVLFVESFGVRSGICALHWLTDTVLVAVGLFVNDDASIDIFIINYRINTTSRTVETTYYFYDNAFHNKDRDFLKLNWYEHRADYFEIR